MTSEQLCYVIELANYNTLQKTADALHISKSGLSKAIHQIESELGLQLFHRTPSGTYLTRQGQELLPTMEKELSINFKLNQQAADLKNSPNGQIIRIGHTNSLLKPVFNEFLQMKKDHHFTNLEVSQHSTTKLIELVRSQQLDLAFIDIDRTQANQLGPALTFHEIHHGPLQMYIPAGNPLSKKEKLTIDDLRSLSFVTMGNQLSQEIFNHLQNICGPLRVALKTDDYWSACKATKELNAGFVVCKMELKNAVPNLEDWGFTEKQLSQIIDDQVYHGWVSNHERPLNDQTVQFVNRVAKRIVSVLD